MRFLVLFVWFLVSVAVFPGAEPKAASATEIDIITFIDVAANDIICKDGAGHSPCQGVLALTVSAFPPDLASAAYGSGLSQLRTLGPALAPQPPPPRHLS